jgi:hypothetical protein
LPTQCRVDTSGSLDSKPSLAMRSTSVITGKANSARNIEVNSISKRIKVEKDMAGSQERNRSDFAVKLKESLLPCVVSMDHFLFTSN